MSIFKTENCPICGKPTNAFEKTSAKYNGLFICKSCFHKITQAGINVLQLKNKSLDELQSAIGRANQTFEEHQNEINNFNITKKVANYLYLDENQRKFALPTVTLTGKIKDMDIYNYDDIVDYELIEDGNSISKGGIGRALVGGTLFGGVGAVVGGVTGHKQKQNCTKLQIKITMNNIYCPALYIKLIDSETKKDGVMYQTMFKFAQEILSLLNIICQNHCHDNDNMTANDKFSPADEIKKYKELLDMGAITLEEFEKKKKDLLNL